MKISIITPSYNQGKYIKRTIESVSSQSNADVEHIVVDGGSNDQTVEVLKTFGDRIKWVSERDEGQADAVNKGINWARGEIIGWLNSDDIYYPRALETVIKLFESREDVDVIYGKADHIDENDHPFEEYPTEDWDYERLKDTCFICQPALFFRKSVVDDIGLLNKTLQYAMDYEYWIRIGKSNARVLYVKDKLAGSRLYADNKTLGSRIHVHKEINDMMLSHFGKVPDRWISNYAHAVIDENSKLDKGSKVYILRLIWLVFYSSLRWNKGISRELRSMLREWFLRAG